MMDKQAVIAQLREQISAVEWQHLPSTAYALGIGEIDAALKHGGIATGCCHEIFYSESGPALGFALHLLAAIAVKGPVLWCSEKHDFYTPGFTTYGIKDTDIIFTETKNQQQSLWAMEQGLICNDFSAVVITAKKISLSQGRRLKLLAQKHDTIAIFMIQGRPINLSSIATTRWLITSQVSEGHDARNGRKIVGKPRLTIKLIRNLGGIAPRSWTVEFDDRTLRFYTLPTFLPSTNQNRSPRIDFGACQRSA